MRALRFVGLWAPVAGFMISTQLLASPRLLPRTSGEWDKLLHVGAYGLFAVACLRAFHGGLSRLRRRPTWLALALVLSYGLVDELRQATIPGRIASVADWIADACGGLLAPLGWERFERLRRRRADAERKGDDG